MGILIGGKTPESIEIGGKAVQSLAIGGEVVWSAGPPPSPPDYLYVQNTYSGQNTVTLKKNGTLTTGTTIEYSTDQSTWNTPTYDVNNECQITLSNQNDKVYFRSSDGFSTNTRNYYNIFASQNHSIGGDIKTVVDYTVSGTVTTRSGEFYKMFANDSKLIDASALDITNVTLSDGLFYYFFWNCTELTAPARFSTANPPTACYGYMYSGCTSLQSITVEFTAPGKQACYYMFQGCSSLNEVISYISDISAQNCTSKWMINVSVIGDFYNLGDASFTDGDDGIPSGWTEHT